MREIGLKKELLESERQEVLTRDAVTAAKNQAAEARACLARFQAVVGEVTSMMRKAPDTIDDMLNAELAVFVRRVRCATADSIGDVEAKLLEVTRSEPNGPSGPALNES